MQFSTTCYCPGENERLKRNEIGAAQSGKAGESPVLITAAETGSVCHIFSTVTDKDKHTRSVKPQVWSHRTCETVWLAKNSQCTPHLLSWQKQETVFGL